ncbi:MAG: DUF1365 family protein [Alphaproteobacteria bacterium]|nr:DUF1365 family protein [Alphaproteobacteria bacterium]
MSDPTSALYVGAVMHQRLRPRRHRLRYRVFSLLLDLDELDTVAGRLRLFSRNRFNLFSFFDRDHGNGSGTLREQVEGRLRAAGIEPDGGAIRLLTMPRLLGYAFNPLSVFFCYRRTGSLAAIVYEVSNTFGERHNYLIPVHEHDGAGTIHQECDKRFFVSPFLDMDMVYLFRVIPPGQRIGIAISGRDAQGPIIIASLFAKRTPLTDACLARASVTFPLLTLKVIAGIHWEALRIWLKGTRLRTRPPPPAPSVTLGRAIDPRNSAAHVAR